MFQGENVRPCFAVNILQVSSESIYVPQVIDCYADVIPRSNLDWTLNDAGYLHVEGRHPLLEGDFSISFSLDENRSEVVLTLTDEQRKLTLSRGYLNHQEMESLLHQFKERSDLRR